LCVTEQEADGLVLQACFQHALLYIFSPFIHAVIFRQLDLEKLIISPEQRSALVSTKKRNVIQVPLPHSERLGKWSLTFLNLNIPNQVEQKLLRIHETAENGWPNLVIFISFMISPYEIIFVSRWQI